MKSSTLIKQHDMRDCGAACLASVAGHYGVQLPISTSSCYCSYYLQRTIPTLCGYL
ncbi:cysteine peptidase family C39 domain-containing protein [Capnocytophaga leadbetteri]|uniref:cysteine peptidase family C39 domain-containing protein n=1 Tax=Capnocytophaga leadbetteri TaxID=327575 RepID=UPI002936F99C